MKNLNFINRFAELLQQRILLILNKKLLCLAVLIFILSFTSFGQSKKETTYFIPTYRAFSSGLFIIPRTIIKVEGDDAFSEDTAMGNAFIDWVEAVLTKKDWEDGIKSPMFSNHVLRAKSLSEALRIRNGLVADAKRDDLKVYYINFDYESENEDLDVSQHSADLDLVRYPR